MPKDLQAEGVDESEESPIVWFVELVLAQNSGDFRRAAESQEQLEQIGYVVRFRKPRAARKAVVR